MTFEEVWKQLEAKDDCYRRAREMAELSIEQLEYAYNSGYEQGKNDRPQGEWKLDSLGVYCSECKKHPDYSSDFCPFCGARMKDCNFVLDNI